MTLDLLEAGQSVVRERFSYAVRMTHLCRLRIFLTVSLAVKGKIMSGERTSNKDSAEAKNPAAAAASAAASAIVPTDMVFESEDFRSIPTGVKQVLLKIALAGDNQSASLGVAVFEQLTPQSQFVLIAKQEIDNLANTPEESFLPIAPIPGAAYAITFVGEMHSLSLADAPLSLTLRISAEGVGTPIEDFGGQKTVQGRFCAVRGRALLRAAA